MADVSLTTGRRRSQSSRTRIGGIDVGGISVPNRDFARVHSARTPVDTRDLSRRIGDFFTAAEGLVEVDHQRNLMEIRRENSDKIAELQAAVHKDTRGAREAIDTGDYSKFTGNLGDRRVVANAFQIATAGAMAAEDLPALEEGIQQLPDDADPKTFVDKWLNDQLKGTTGLFGAAYAEAISPAAQRSVGLLRQARVERQTERAFEAASGAMTAHFRNGGEATQGALVALRQSFISSLPIQGPAAVMEGEARFETELAGMAASGDARALQMLATPDPERDGISWADRNPNEFDKVRAQHLGSLREVKSIEEQQALDQIQIALQTGQMTRTQANAQLRRLQENLGRSNNMSARALSMFGEDPPVKPEGPTELDLKLADENAILSATDQGAVAMLESTGDLNSGLTRLFQRSLLGDPGVPPERMAHVLALQGTSPQVRDYIGRVYSAGGNSEQFEAVHTIVTAAKDALPGGTYADFMDTDQAALAEVIVANATQLNVSPAQARTALEGQDPGVSPKLYLSGQVRDPGDPTSPKYGEAGTLELAAEAWENSDLGSVPGMFNDVGFSGLSPALQQEIATALSTHAWGQHMSGRPLDIAAAQAAAVETIRNRVGWAVASDGTTYATLNNKPSHEKAPDGSIQVGTTPSLEEVQTAFEFASTSDVSGYMSREGIQLTPDDITRVDASYGVYAAGGQPLAATPGQQFAFPREEFETHGNLGGLLEVVTKDDTTVVLRVAEPKPGRLMANEHMGWVYDDMNRMWRARYYYPQPKGPMTGAGLDAARADEISTPALREAISPDEKFPVSEGLAGAREDQRQQAIKEAQHTLGASETAARTAVTGRLPGSPNDQVVDAMLSENRLPKGPGGETGEQRFIDLANELNGLSHIPYAADTRRSLSVPSQLARGREDALIGFGFNMGRPDANELLEKVGVDLKGTPLITRQQAEALAQLAMRRDLKTLRDQIPAGTRLRTHQIQALLLTMQARPKGLSGEVLFSLKNGGDVAGAITRSFPTGRAPQLLAERLALLYRGN